MSKFRPTPNNCIYVCPDIHGQIDELNLILDRIIPLRDNKNATDKLIFLGDYIDRGPNSPAVLDRLIGLKKKYNDQVVFLRGNHESLLLMASGREPPWSDPLRPSPYAIWVCNGGNNTVIQYAARNGLSLHDGMHLQQSRAISFVETKHLDFLQRDTVPYYELDNYIFVHAGCDPFAPMNEQSEEILLWDRSLYEFSLKMKYKKQELPWNKTIITGHNFKGPLINEKFMMLDCSASRKLLLIELNSMQSFSARFGKKRMVKENLCANY
jgi:serine/threonine protein phosphatase 1